MTSLQVPAEPAVPEPAISEVSTTMASSAPDQTVLPSGASVETSPGRQILVTDPSAVKALAHRARVLAIDELFGSRATRTATELADLTGLTPSAMSYHLRELERFGLVKRVENQAGSGKDGRERHWQATGDTVVISSAGGQSTQLTDYAQTRLDAFRDSLVTEIDYRERVRQNGEPGPEIPYLYYGSLFLDEESEKEFMQRLEALEDEFSARSQDAAGASGPRRRTYYLLSALPDRRYPFPGEPAHEQGATET